MRTAARTAVIAGTATAVSGRVARRQQGPGEESPDAAAPEAPPPPPPAGGLSAAAIDQLKQLGALHEQGVLTDEEFAAEKAKLLGG